MTAIVGDSMIKDVYGWELSAREEKVVVKHFSGSTTEDMKTYIQSPLKRDPSMYLSFTHTVPLNPVVYLLLFLEISTFYLTDQ